MIESPSLAAKLATIGHRWRFAVVLLASLLLAVAQPLTGGLFNERDSFDLFFSLLIVAVLLLVFEDKEHRRIAVTLGLAALLAVWASRGFGGSPGQLVLVVAYLLAVGFFGFSFYGILRAIFARDMPADAILGAVCGHLLLGIIWTVLYSALETAYPGSFKIPQMEDVAAASVRHAPGTLGYFSFITLATVGYGDVTPATPLAGTLAWMEAVAGQFYLAVLVAGLVGFKVTQAIKD